MMACPPSMISSGRTFSPIVCRDELSPLRRQELASKLRTITGWSDLAFDEFGALRVGSKPAVGGSPSARELLRQALSSKNVIVLEDASNRPDVIFCRVIPGRWINNKHGDVPAYVVLIDFADFDHLMGDKAALKAFDVGWGFLHELDHVINDSTDPQSLSESGECEEHINLMRRECNLPLRTDYFFTFFPHAANSDFKTRFVRLAFKQDDAGSAKHRRYWIIWDATLVGLPAPTEIAERKFSL